MTSTRARVRNLAKTWATPAAAVIMTAATIWGIWITAAHDQGTPQPNPSPAASR